MKFTKTILAALFALSALNAQAAASVNLVVNGSFEDNLQAPGTWHIYNSLTGWTSGKYGIELRDNVAGKAKDGKNFVELDTTANSMMTQDIHIGNAGQYQLSFFYAARPDNGRRNLDTDRLEWSFAGKSGEVLPEWNAPNATNWHPFVTTVSFDNAHIGSQALTFRARGTSDSYGGSIDNISVTAVPEPESYALLLAGLGLMGTIARRRKSRD